MPTSRETVDFGGGQVTSPFGALVAKYDASGAYVWGDTFASDQIVARDIAFDVQGNIVVEGWLYAPANFGGGPIGPPQLATNPNTFLLGLDGSGVYAWSKVLPDGVYGDRIRIDAVGNIALLGAYAGTPDLGSGPLLGGADTKVFVAEFDASRTLVWSRGFGAFGYGTRRTEFSLDGAGNVSLGGIYQGGIDFGTGLLTSGGNGGDLSVFVAKLDSTGNGHWARSFDVDVLSPSTGDANFGGIGFSPEGDVVVVGDVVGWIQLDATPLDVNGLPTTRDVFAARLDGTEHDHDV